MDKIPIYLDENPTIGDPQLSVENSAAIAVIIKQAQRAQQARIDKKAAKTADEKLTQEVISELLVNPAGISKVDMLAAGEAENIISLVLKIRNHLKKHKIYTLIKKGKGNNTIYRLSEIIP